LLIVLGGLAVLARVLRKMGLNVCVRLNGVLGSFFASFIGWGFFIISVECLFVFWYYDIL
jgi:hypothetical protein